MYEQTRRPLSPQDRHDLRARVLRSRRHLAVMRRRLSVLVPVAALLPCAGVLVAVALGRLALPPVAGLALWAAVAGLVGAWALRDVAVRERTLQASLRRALRKGWCQESRVKASALVELEELKGLGDCFALQVGAGKVLFLHGQAFYASRRFPTTDFSLLELYAAEGERVETRIVLRGEALAPARVIPQEALQGLVPPAHGQLLAGSLDGLEEQLRTPRVALRAV
jgi:hypothetical protein